MDRKLHVDKVRQAFHVVLQHPSELRGITTHSHFQKERWALCAAGTSSDECQWTRAERLQRVKSQPDLTKQESRQLSSAILRLTCVRLSGKNKKKTSITNIWRTELLRWLHLTARFQIRGNITALAERFSGVRPWSLLAVRAGCHADCSTSPQLWASNVSTYTYSICCTIKHT